MSIGLLSRTSMVVALVMDVNDRAARQWGKRGRHSNQIKGMAVKMVFDCSSVSSEDGVQLQQRRGTTRRK